MNSFFKLIRRITIPPVFAFALLVTAYIIHPSFFGSVWHLVAAVFFLCILPTLAYPLQKCFTKYKDRGREGQCYSAGRAFSHHGSAFLYRLNLINNVSKEQYGNKII